MRRVYEHEDEARAKGARAAEDMRDRYGPDQTATFLTKRLD
jgi:hypothetical protein